MAAYRYPFTFITGLVFFFCTAYYFATAQTFRLDTSIQRKLDSSPNDSSKFEIYSTLFSELRAVNPTAALEIARQHLDAATKQHNLREMANAKSNLGSCNTNLGNYKEAFLYGFGALKIRESLNDKQGIASSYSNIGLVYDKQNQHQLALNYLLKSLQLREELQDKKGMSASYNNLGLVYLNMQNESLALKNYFKSLEIREELKDKKGKAQALNNIATVYIRQNSLEKALEFLYLSLKLKEELNDQHGIAATYDNLGDANFKIYERKQNANALDKAIFYYQKSLAIARALKIKEIAKTCCQSLSEAYHKKGDDTKAYLFFKEFSALKDTLFNEDILRTTAELQGKYQTAKQEKEIALLLKDKIIAANKDRWQRFLIISGILFTILAIGFLLYRYQLKQRANSLLTQKNKLIDQNRSDIKKQKDIIEQRNRALNDSMEYARNVQSIILPGENELKKMLPDAFVLFLPKDVVSGDFYWTYQDGKRVWLAVIDCTGHGIPGAMMSFLGYNLLENVVTQKGIERPGHLLKELNDAVFSTLSKKNENLNSKYGMDISVISIDTELREIVFSGAHHSLYKINGGELVEFKGDKYSIGTLYTGIEKEFSEHKVFYKTGDLVYLSTDGFADQIGGNDRKKLYQAPFKKLLCLYATLSMKEQHAALERSILSWKGTRDQTDDILVVGIKLN